MAALLLGVGNLLLSDEAVGVRVVERFATRFRSNEQLEIIDGGTAGMELLDTLANRELVVIVDAVATGDAPGTLVQLSGEAVPTFFARKISPHQLGLSDLLSALVMTGEQPDKVVLLGVVPESIELGLDLTPSIQALLDTLVDKVAGVLKQEGMRLEEAA